MSGSAGLTNPTGGSQARLWAPSSRPTSVRAERTRYSYARMRGILSKPAAPDDSLRKQIRTAPRHPKKHPHQRRSRATIDTIFDATVQVLLANGFDKTTTIQIADRAGVSIGSLYQYFPNKRALLAAIV